MVSRGRIRNKYIWTVVVAAGTGRDRCRGPLGGHDGTSTDGQTGRVDYIMM